MKFDKTKFFDGFREEFNNLRQYHVDGLERLLDLYETYWGWWDFLPQIANSLAQIKLETAHSFIPVVEGFYLAGNVSIDRNYFQGNYENVRNFQRQLDYYPHFGRGDIQLTWRHNYRKHDTLVKHYFPEIVDEFNANNANNLDLIRHPAQTLDGKISFCIMTVGMHKGTFRSGHHLDRYISPVSKDYFNAREIVNGDKNFVKQGKKVGNRIKGYSIKFEKILEDALE